MRYVLFFVFLVSNFFANDTLVLKDNTLPTSTLGYEYFQITDKNLTSKDILYSHILQKADRLNLGIITKPIWTKVKIKNSFKSTRQFILYNERAGTNYIDVYIYKNNKLFKKHILGDMIAQNKKEILHRYSLFALDLAPDEEITIVAKVQNGGPNNIGWHINETIEFFNNEQHLTLLFGLVGGFLFVYIIFNIIMYFSSKEKIYLMLSGVVVGILFYIYSVYGYLYSFDIGLSLDLITALAWVSPLISTIFLLLVPYYFFDMKSKYSKLSKTLLGLIFLFFAMILITLYILYIDSSLFKFYGLITLIYLFTPLFVFILALYLYMKKEQFSLYYLLGQFFLTVINIYHTLEILGIIHMSFFTPLFLPTGILIDASFLFAIVYLQSKYFLKEQYLQKELLMDKLRFASIGQAIGGVVHQWKTPITYIGNIITTLESSLNFKSKDEVIKQLESYLPELNYNINHISKTTQEILGVYNTKHKSSQEIHPKKIINEHIRQILASKMTLKNVKIICDISDEFVLKIDENIFVNMMMILLENSLNAKENNIEIHLDIKKEAATYHIIFSDNCGGIELNNINNIFDYQMTTKKDGHGIGLAILKMLVTEKLNGDIKVQNKNDGVEFRIKIPILDFLNIV